MNLRHFEILSLSLRYLFVLLVLYILTVSFIKTIWDNNRINTRGTSGKVPFIIALFSLSAFGLLAGLGSLGYDYFVLLLGLLVSLVVVFQFYFLYYFIDGIDEVILSIVDFLFVIGLVTLQRLSPELAVKQLLWFILGNIGLFFLMLFFSRDKGLSKWTYPMMVFGLLTLLAVLFLLKKNGVQNAISPLGIFLCNQVSSLSFYL